MLAGRSFQRVNCGVHASGSRNSWLSLRTGGPGVPKNTGDCRKRNRLGSISQTSDLSGRDRNVENRCDTGERDRQLIAKLAITLEPPEGKERFRIADRRPETSCQLQRDLQRFAGSLRCRRLTDRRLPSSGADSRTRCSAS